MNSWTVIVVDENGRVSPDTLPPEGAMVSVETAYNKGTAINASHLYGGAFDTELGTATPLDIVSGD